MSGKKRKSGAGDTDKGQSPGVEAGGWQEKKHKIRWRKFPGPEGIDEPVRLALSKRAYADLVGHAKESLAAEICGVLVGDFCEDENGDFVSVEAIIRGEAAKEHGTQVTFTQETWNRIHDCRQREHPKLDIVGWYHTHPGFGVEFSDMDLFIQRNFFGRRNQVALVTDPLGGDDAVCVNTDAGIAYLSRFWVDGRERTCRIPGGEGELNGRRVTGTTAEWVASLQAVEDRLAQLTARVEDQRLSLSRFLLTLSMVVCAGVVVLVGYGIYNRMIRDDRPPETVRWAEIPVRIEDETYFMGVQIVRWKAPERVWNSMVNAVTQALEAEAKAKEEAEAKAKALLENAKSEESATNQNGSVTDGKQNP